MQLLIIIRQIKMPLILFLVVVMALQAPVLNIGLLIEPIAACLTTVGTPNQVLKRIIFLLVL